VYLGVEEDVGVPGVELPVVLLAVGHRAEILTRDKIFTLLPFYEYLHSLNSDRRNIIYNGSFLWISS
jgi:hypothetical protein